MKKTAVLAAALFGLAAATPAYADVEVGTLSCHSAAPTSYVVFSGQPFDCIFKSAAGPIEHYHAFVHRFGAQIGFSNDVSLAWAVFAPTPHVGPGSLAGSYGGLSAGAAIGIGGSANGLVGGGNSLTLQPLSLQGEVGLNVVATVTGLDLEPAGPVHRHYRHRRHHH